MKLKLFFVPLIGTCLVLMSATSVTVTDSLNNAQSTIAENNSRSTTLSRPGVKKMGFFQRIAYKMMIKKMKKQARHMEESAEGNNGNVALALGTSSLLLTLIPLVAGGFLLGWIIAIPLSILAMIFGSKPKTGKYNIKAKIGKWFGFSSILIMVVITLIAFAAWAAFWS
jgi:hypothetical protein